MYRWNLDNLYLGLDDNNFINDMVSIDEIIDKLNDLSTKLNEGQPELKLEEYLKTLEKYHFLARKLMSFVYLTLATDSTNTVYNNAMVVLQQKFVRMTLANTLFEKFVSQLSDLDLVINKSNFLKEYAFILLEIKDNSIHLLSEQEEVLAAELNQSGGSLFSKMQNDLTSTLEVDYNGEVITLSKVRNLAYDANPKVRKAAYEAELEAYKKIEKASSFALNGIKKQVLTISKKRKYSSPLEKTLKDSRINQEVLDALLSAMKEYLPDFRRYLKRKGELLGHQNGLPFYDLFAPMGSSDRVYSVEEAQKFILKNFATFSPDLHDLAKRAFSENWIDYLPRAKKRGGAFCYSIYSIKESRIMTNFDGSISDISTIAHELGHAYHNIHLFDGMILNSSYPMPIAETASILCETIVKKAAYQEATTIEEKLGMLEQELQDSTQVIVDILSRYIFETNAFKRCEQEFLDENTLNQMMLDAQLESYGDGLDPKYLNSGMWINKSHYYSTSRSFYNFPYAFGLLFAKGIYAKYIEVGPAFVNDLKKLLSISGKANLMDVAKSINIDITDINFWRSSLAVVKEDIELFMELTK